MKELLVEWWRVNYEGIPDFFSSDGTEDTHLKVYCIDINEIFGFIYLASLALHCVSLPGS